MRSDHQDCGCGCGEQIGFPANAATALNYHFGMLLGVEDLRAEQGFHTGRQQRHHRELHGYGVLRGLNVQFDKAKSELRVMSGFAVDMYGREIEILKPQCLDLSVWLTTAMSGNPGFTAARGAKGYSLDLIVSAGACFERPVPAMAAECNGSDNQVAYSRLTEQPHLDLILTPKPVAAVPDVMQSLLGSLEAGTYTPDANDREALRLKAFFVQATSSSAAPGDLLTFSKQLMLVASLNDAGQTTATAALEDDHITLARLIDVDLVANPIDGKITVGEIQLDVRPLLMPTRRMQTALMMPQWVQL